MSVNLNSLTTYVDENKLDLIAKAILGARTSKHLNLQTGIKGATTLNLLDTNVVFGDGSTCGWNEAGEQTISQRTLTPVPLKVNMSYCDKAMLKYFMNNEVNVAAGRENLPFESKFISEVLKSIDSKIDNIIWNGIKIGSTTYKGLLGIATEGAVTATAGTTAYGAVRNVYGAIPARSLETTKIFVGMDTYRDLIMELTEKNLFHYKEQVESTYEFILPGTTTTVVGVPGLNGTKKVVALNTEHTVYGVDMQSDAETFDFWYSKDNQEFRLAVDFLVGVQVAFLDEMVVGQIGE